ncbi:MAG TPA: T9SS type A sorting domain-containing protein [Candidatus Kapabacteria bacterium]
MNRRNFLEKAVGATMAAAVAPSLLEATDAFAGGGTEPLGTVVLNLNETKFNKLKNVDGSVVYPNNINSFYNFVITRISSTTFSVIAAKCTHLGCLVSPYDITTTRISCGCHGSQFDIAGVVKTGPASKSLKQYQHTYDATANTLTITDASLDISPSNDTPLVLNQNYPNPFTGMTTISFEIPSSANASLVITDINGNEVATLHNGVLGSGKHELQFNGSALAAGTYFYKLSTPNGTLVKQMEIVR